MTPRVTAPRYRNAFITGGSGGIGEALAVELGRRGTAVAIAARRKEELERVAARVREAGGTATVVELDVRDPAAIGRALGALEQSYDGLDLVVANAGIGYPTPAATADWKGIQAILDVNVIGAIATVAFAAPAMAKRKRGHLVGISSIASFRGMPQNAAYSASKAALATYLESMRIDLRRQGVRVTSVHPGYIRTPMTAKNKHPMPFLMDADVAARKILRAIDRGRAVYAFPWPMVAALRASRLLPYAVFDAIVSRLSFGKFGAER